MVSSSLINITYLMIEFWSEKNDKITSTSRTPVASVKVHFTYSQKKDNKAWSFDEKKFLTLLLFSNLSINDAKASLSAEKAMLSKKTLKGDTWYDSTCIPLGNNMCKAITNDQKRQSGKGGNNRAMSTSILRIGAVPAHMFCLFIKWGQILSLPGTCLTPALWGLRSAAPLVFSRPATTVAPFLLLSFIVIIVYFHYFLLR